MSDIERSIALKSRNGYARKRQRLRHSENVKIKYVSRRNSENMKNEYGPRKRPRLPPHSENMKSRYVPRTRLRPHSENRNGYAPPRTMQGYSKSKLRLLYSKSRLHAWRTMRQQIHLQHLMTTCMTVWMMDLPPNPPVHRHSSPSPLCRPLLHHQLWSHQLHLCLVALM
jgi:hypothetical protein